VKHTHDNQHLLKDAVKHWDLSKWSRECSKLLPEQLIDIASLATPEEDVEAWKKKLHLILVSFPPHLSLESLGRALTVVQVLEILQFLATPANHLMSRQQLSSLFVGLSPLVFREVVSQATDQQLYFFKEEAVTEVVQHHLSLIVHELNEELKALGDEIQASESQIDTVVLEDLNSEEIADLYLKMDRLSEKANELLHLTNHSLVIAWNSSRVDLIQELGRIKELCQRCLLDHIGQVSEQEIASAGLRQRLENKVNALFSDRDAHGHVTFMKETTPALEALVKFSVWYVQDYAEIGLYHPLVKNSHVDSARQSQIEASRSERGSPSRIGKGDEEDRFGTAAASQHGSFQLEDGILPELDFDPAQTDAKNLKRREELLVIAEENLNYLGLHTLRDLKAAKIYSKQSLIEYISEKKAFL